MKDADNTKTYMYTFFSLIICTSSGRYQLRFIVSDNHHGLRNVEANVTVLVKRIGPDEIRHTTPITLAANSLRLVRPLTEVGHADCA